MVSAWMPQGTIMKHIQDLGGPMFANVVRYVRTSLKLSFF